MWQVRGCMFPGKALTSQSYLCGAMATLGRPLVTSEAVLEGQMRKDTAFLGYLLLDTSTLKIRFWGTCLSFLSINSHPGEKESSLEISFYSSRSLSLSFRFWISDWFDLNALEDLKEIRKTIPQHKGRTGGNH